LVSDDLYFKVWEDTFEIETKATVKVEEVLKQITKENNKPQISVSTVELIKPETKKSVEKIVEKIEKEEKEEIEEVENIVENVEIKKDNIIKKDLTTLSFDKFFNKYEF